MVKTRKYIILSMFFLIIAPRTKAEEVFDVNFPQQAENVSRTKRMRKAQKKSKTESEVKEKKIRTYMDMEYDQLVQAKDAQRASGNLPSTIKYLDQLLKMTKDITLLAEHLLELADVLFEDKQFKKAGYIYSQYCALYPGSEKQEYALYRSIQSSFASRLSFDRDQTITEETVALADLFLKQDVFTLYRQEVIDIQRQCFEQLAESECNVCTFYINKGSLRAAEKRLNKIRTYWLAKLPSLEANITALETAFLEKKELAELMHTKNATLAQNGKKHMANRF